MCVCACVRACVCVHMYDVCIYIQVFRSFQGWLALSAQGPNDGTLEVVPLVAEAMAYVLLRPFLPDVPVHQLCGVNDTGGGDTLEITSRWHALLLRAKLPIGHVDPGDTVWWHPDVIHGVEALHQGTTPSNVLYIAATPMCVQNAKYMVQQREAYQRGDAPPGFPNLHLERTAGRVCPVGSLSVAGRRAMGIEPYPEAVIAPEAVFAGGQGAGGEDGGGGHADGATGRADGGGRAAQCKLLTECNAIMFQDLVGSGDGQSDPQSLR